MVETRVESGQQVWVIETAEVELCLTRRGGMTAPVSFRGVGSGDQGSVRPYYISPWQGESLAIDEPVLVPLRGDFFCAPFGAGREYRGRMVPGHGAPATADWNEPEISRRADSIVLQSAVESPHPRGRITKQLKLRTGHHAIYSIHTIEGFEIPLPVGHHPNLVASDDAPLLISRSAVRSGQVQPSDAPYYADGEYHSLRPGATFSSVTEVPTIWADHPTADCSVFPAREGFVDIIATFDEQQTIGAPRVPAWTVAARPAAGYLWYSLKDPNVLPASLFWMENLGRHQHPWNGRNRCIGLEEVCACFALGLVPSVTANELQRLGIPTAIESPAEVRFIQGVVGVPPEFGRVATVTFEAGAANFTDTEGNRISAAVDWSFLFPASDRR